MLFVCMYACMYVYMHVCIYAYKYVCKMTFSSGVVNSCGDKCSSEVCVKKILWFLFNFLLHA